MAAKHMIRDGLAGRHVPDDCRAVGRAGRLPPFGGPQAGGSRGLRRGMLKTLNMLKRRGRRGAQRRDAVGGEAELAGARWGAGPAGGRGSQGQVAPGSPSTPGGHASGGEFRFGLGLMLNFAIIS